MTGPFTAAYRNILVGGEHAAALYRLDTVSYRFLGQQEQEHLHGQLAWFAYSVEADFSVWRVSRAHPAETYVADTVGMVDDRLADPDDWEAYLATHAEHIAGMRSFDTEVYLAVALQTRRKPWERRAARHAAVALADAEQTTFDNLLEHLPARRVRAQEIQWLLRRAPCRGLGEPEPDPYWTPPALLTDGTAESMSLLRHQAAVYEEGRALVVESDEGTSYQSMLTMGTLPRTSQFPGGAELLFTPLEDLDFPVDAVMHVRWIDNEQMQSLLGKRVIDADNTAEEDPNAQSWQTGRAPVEARDVLDYFASEPYPPGLDSVVSFAVGAESRDELKERVRRLRKRFGSVKLHQPFGLQADLYEDHLPRPDGGRVRGAYAAILNMEQFGALMPIGTHHAGAARGVYFGRTVPGTPRPVKVDLTEASRTHRAPSVLLCGALGRGKTIAAELLCLQAAMRGSVVVDVDPKARPDHNLEALPHLRGRVHVIELSGEDANRGLLDPMVIPPEAVREDLAASYFMEILPQAPAPWATQIRKAVKAVLAEPEPSSLRVLEWLARADHDEARQAGEALEVWADAGLGRLAFGDGSRAQAQAELPVTTIKAPGLTLPPPGVPRGDYDRDEQMGVATVKLLVGYAMRLIAGDRTIHKVLHFDEAHVLLASGDGRRLLDRLNRMGRSVNATLVLSTQLLGDVGDDIEALIGARLVFGQETDAQAKAVLPILGLDPGNDKLVRLLRGFTAGRCLMRGIDDRVAAVQVDPVDPGILAALDTAPGRSEALEGLPV